MVNKLNPRLQEPLEEQPLDTQGFERPRNLLNAIDEDLAPLLDLAQRPVVSTNQFTREQLLQLARLAARYETQPQMITRPLTGKILVSAFYEPSTRTRLSFESAWHRLGGDIMSITDPASTGIAKGETLYDVGEMLNHYGDLVVLRDSNEQAVYEMLESLRIPIINGGNGTDEHPTQALADIYVLLKWRPTICQPELDPTQRIRIGIIGVPGRMRTVRSLLVLLGLFSDAIAEVVIVSDKEQPFAAGQREELEAAGLTLRITRDLNQSLPDMDVIYINTIAWIGDDYEELGSHYRLEQSSPLKPDSIILHPLARGDELPRELDNTSHNWYFAQARGAVFIRMALLSSIMKTFT
ncbi:MAG: aspartate carbamoyltransferase [Candidatus Thiodiazotropha sp. (ex. Lucinisca nassula)]|nr:aspartate carbamoyltransferase [Candidatus Thiodiazotropha sp. (ex. Lucinisca nassula)]PUB86327.1 MAG: aspartate carbamoyltransferase [gamma proteobacterium symbiont of Ctena orbiculata]